MSQIPNCPACKGSYAYKDGNLLICPECGHEWSKFADQLAEEKARQDSLDNAVRDAYGNILNEGDDATMVKDVKISGSSDVLKQGTRVTEIRFESDGVHDIVAKVDGFGTMNLKSELIKKS